MLTCCINPACCGWLWGGMPWGPPGVTLTPPIIPMDAPDGVLLEVGPPCCGAATARRSSDSCWCFAAASWPPPPPRLLWSWLASPPLVNPNSEELMSSSGRSCSSSKSEPKSRHTGGKTELLPARKLEILLTGFLCFVFNNQLLECIGRKQDQH